jgi:hypothetical protein
MYNMSTAKSIFNNGLFPIGIKSKFLLINDCNCLYKFCISLLNSQL